MPLPIEWIPEAPMKYTVQLDAYLIDKWMTQAAFSRGELIATILHEIGHVVNVPPPDCQDSVEHWADDYARYCGFGQPLLSALEKLITLDPEHFDTPITSGRIDRIKNGDLAKVGWSSSEPL
jgi:hypothetical protein